MNHWELPIGRLLRNGPNSQTVQTGNWNERQRQTKPCCSSFEACGFHPDDSNEFLVMDADYARHGASRRAPTQNYMYSIQSQRISQNARGYCSEVQNARWMQVPFNASGSMQWWHDMTWHVLARHYMTWHLHHCIDLLIVWLHEDARPSSSGEQAKGGGGQVEKWTRVNFFWFVQEIFLYVSICAIEFRGCKSWPKRAPLSILFILILDTYLGPTSHKMRNWTWSWFRENLPCQLLISELENAGFWRFRAEWKPLAAMAVESCAACGLIQALYGRCTWPPFAKVHPQLRLCRTSCIFLSWKQTLERYVQILSSTEVQPSNPSP